MRNRATTPLSKAKIRQSWSKYNLYNLNRLRNPPTVTRTFFQQKWAAKSAARTYHGEQVRENQWTRIFSRRIRSVVPMNPGQLAQDDGFQMSAGRGSGLEKQPGSRGGSGTVSPPRTPFAQMTFAPLERRLDVAIFRAMFASSTRQARQFVIHDAVTVNGKKMRHPGYLLNPGDLFQVDPERVMFATGAPKDKAERREGRLAKRAAVEVQKPPRTASNEDAVACDSLETPSEGVSPGTDGIPEEQDTRETLKSLLAQAKTILSHDKDVLPAKRKQEFRCFQRAVRSILSRSTVSSVLTDNLQTQFAELISLLRAKRASSSDSPVASSQPLESSPTTTPTVSRDAGIREKLKEAFQKATQDPTGMDEEAAAELSEAELAVLRRALEQLRENPIDSSKPYSTPWRPRDYMSAFAFIPRYLEVNQNICAAVYLRHPVARPGVSEVPSPFGESVGTAAFAWYLRRR